MLTIYIVVNRCPAEFTEPGEIYTARFTKRAANKWLRQLKANNPYLYQYAVVEPLKVTV